MIYEIAYYDDGDIVFSDINRNKICFRIKKESIVSIQIDQVVVGFFKQYHANKITIRLSNNRYITKYAYIVYRMLKD
jgi:hypothetical protein